MSEGKNIQGNVNVSRNANIGGNMSVRGGVAVGHNLVVKGWLDAPNIKGPLKGLFASESALKTAYPRPMPGWFALVGNTLPADVWCVDRGKWVPTGETGGEFNLWLDQLETDVKDITDDVRDLEELLDNGLLLEETIAFSSTGTAAAMTFTVMKRDGSTKEHSKPIPIVTAEKAGMMSAADKKELSAATIAIATLNDKIKTLETDTENIVAALEKEIKNREIADETLHTLIDKLREDFDAIVGENASDAIENFNEIIAFLAGITDSETLAAKFAELAMQNAGINGAIQNLGEALTAEAKAREQAQGITNRQLSALESKTSPIIVCDGILDYDKMPTRPGVFLQRDEEGDIVQVVETGTELVRTLPIEGKLYVCGELIYQFNGITLEPAGRSHFVFDGGEADTVSDRSIVIGGGEPDSDFNIAKVYDGGEANNSLIF